MLDLLNAGSWQWRESTWLFFLLVPPTLFLINGLLKRKQQTDYADKKLWQWVKVDAQPWVWRDLFNARHTLALLPRLLKPLLGKLLSPRFALALAWMAIVMTLAGPRTSLSVQDEGSRSGVDILLVLDVSKSMDVTDVNPTRFEFSRRLIESYVNRLKSNDRVGLVVFAGRPHLVSPLSFDRALFKHYLSLVSTGLLPTQGSLIKPAVEFGIQHLAQTAGRSQVLMLWTNGEPEEWREQTDTDTWQQIVAAGQPTVRTIVVGVGETQSAKIPDKLDRSGNLHASGLLVTSRLEAPSLKQLAKHLKGSYFKAGRDVQFMNKLIEASTIDAEERTFTSTHQTWKTHDKPFMVLALFALLWAFYRVSFNRFNRANKKSTLSLIPFALVSSIGLFSLGGFSNEAIAAERTQFGAETQSAYDAFKLGEFDLSQQLYDQHPNYDGWFGAGSASYRFEDYESAVMYFRQAAVAGVTVLERSKALYNLGNTYYVSNLLPQAIASYESALQYDSTNLNTHHNLALAKKRQALEEGGNPDEDGEGDGDGSSSKDNNGAFYGGEKADPNNVGKGIAGDAEDGAQDGKEFTMPQEGDKTDYSLAVLQTKNMATQEGNAILAQQQQRVEIERFEQKMQQVEDNQRALLQRIFEREEGFEAAQTIQHPLPGVKTW